MRGKVLTVVHMISSFLMLTAMGGKGGGFERAPRVDKSFAVIVMDGSGNKIAGEKFSWEGRIHWRSRGAERLDIISRWRRLCDEMSFHAQQALRLGLAQGGNHPLDSFATQTVTIPISATVAQLNLRLYPVSSEASLAPQDHSIALGDAQYVSITPSGAETIPATLWMLSNAQMWQRYSFDLTPYAGQTIKVRVGVINDRQGGQTAMYVDSTSLISLGADGHRVYLPVIMK